MYDLHSHILPALDDGPKNIEDSIKMARVADGDGTKVMLCTPHRLDVTQNSSVEHARKLMVDLNTQIKKSGLDLELRLGMENHLDIDLPKEVAEGRGIMMNNSRYALVELPFYGYPNYVEDILYQLQIQGVTPVLAHPERLEIFQETPDLLLKFVERGMLSQITAGSIMGYFGSKAKKITRKLLESGLVHIIASDTHYPEGHRSPLLREGVNAAARIVGDERALTMVVETPKAILEDALVDIEVPRKVKGARRWWFWST